MIQIDTSSFSPQTIIQASGTWVNLNKLLATYAKNSNDFDKISQHINQEPGCFSLIINDKNYNFAISDRIQSYSIYYDIVTGNISRNISDFKVDGAQEQGVLEFATAGYVLGQDTLHKNIKQLQAGEIVHIDKTVSPPKIKTHRYYCYTPTPQKINKSQKSWEKELGNVLDNIFDRMIKSIGDRPICVPLSGGLDSRLILAKLCEHDAKNIHTFSYGLKGNFEAKTAKKVANMLGVDWFMAASDPSKANTLYNSNLRKIYTNQIHGFSRIPSYVEFEALHNVTNQKSIPENSVIINGQTGDYISGGHIPECLYEKNDPSEEDMYRYIFDKHFSLWKNLKTPEIEEKIKEHIRGLLLPYSDDLSKKDNFIRQYESFEWQERQCKMVVNGQKAYDFFGYDWRLPLWDKELMDFFESVPWEYKYKQKLFKAYLQKWNYKGVFDFMSAEPEMWSTQQFWIKWVARAIGIIKSQEAKSDFYKKMSYYSDSHWQYALFGKETYNKHYKNIRNMISLAVLQQLEELNIDFPGDM